MNVLSLFDGMSCGQVALERVGIKVNNYFASEIDKHAIKVTQSNYPNTVQVGDVTKLNPTGNYKIDLLIGGSPCQGFSFSGRQLNFNDPRSKLFFEYVRLLKELKPKYFLLENVRMKKESQDIISKYLGVEPILINSALISAQSRNRYYWTNIPGIVQPTDRGLFMEDIIDVSKGDLKPYSISDTEIQKQLAKLLITSKYSLSFKWSRDTQNRVLVKRPDGLKIQRIGRIAFKGNKTEILTCSSQPFIYDGESIRKVTPTEAESLQTIPYNYTKTLTNNQRYNVLGNGWTIDVIAHIFKNIEV